MGFRSGRALFHPDLTFLSQALTSCHGFVHLETFQPKPGCLTDAGIGILLSDLFQQFDVLEPAHGSFAYFRVGILPAWHENVGKFHDAPPWLEGMQRQVPTLPHRVTRRSSARQSNQRIFGTSPFAWYCSRNAGQPSGSRVGTSL